MNDREQLARLHELHAWQHHYNMTPRSDSKLTDLFVAGQLRQSADEVARELMATDFIFQHTLYGELSPEFFRAVAHRLRSKHNLSWKATWDVVRFYAPLALKLLCLGHAGLRIPQRMPDP